MSPSSWSTLDPDLFFRMVLIKGMTLIAWIGVSPAIASSVFVRHEINKILLMQCALWLMSGFWHCFARDRDRILLAAAWLGPFFTAIFIGVFLTSNAGDASGTYNFVPPTVLGISFVLGTRHALAYYAIYLAFYASVSFGFWDLFEPSLIARVSPNRISIYFDRSLALVVVFGISFLYESVKFRQQKLIKRQARKVAENERLLLVNRMAGGIAHEINNPLTIIHLGLSRLDEQGCTPENWQAVSGPIHRSLGRITDIVRSINSIQKLPATELVSVSIGNCVEMALAAVRSLPRSSEVSTKVELDVDTINLPLDNEHLTEMLHAIVQNAYEANASNPNFILHIKAVRTDAILKLSIFDNGPDFPKDTIQRFADPLFTTKMDTPGRGLGLTRVFAGLSQAGAELEIDRTQGLTSVQLSIPLTLREPAELDVNEL